MIYFDASAMVTLVTRRTNFTSLHGYIETRPGVPLATSVIGLVETVRSCDRTGTFPNLMARLVRQYSELAITTEVRDRAASLPGGLKAMAAIHVATAETLDDQLISFITYDHQMAAVARAIGLPVASPGANF